MKKILCILILAFISLEVSAQETENVSIKKCIVDFLKWHKKNNFNDQNSKQYTIIKNITIAKNLKKQVIDKAGIEKYLNFFRSSKSLSEIYINNLRGYFYEIDNTLRKSPAISTKSIVKIDGLDLDFILQSFEPELILDYIEKGELKEVLILQNKAIVHFYIPQSSVKMLYTLTKDKGIWLIDYIGYYD